MNTIRIQRNERYTAGRDSTDGHGSGHSHGTADIHGFTDIHGFVDIHTHILPGVDDGAASLEQSIRMVRIAAMEGISRIILTPHQRADRRCVTPEGIDRRMKLLQEEINRQKIPVHLYPGSELFYRHGIEDFLTEGKLRTLADSSYCLVEFFPEENYAYIRDGLNRLASYGYHPILAHVERYERLMEEGRVQELKRETGCLYQVNAASLSGETGFVYKSRSRKLLKNALVDFVATDAHNEKERGPRIARCADWLEKRLGAQERKRLLTDNPAAVLADRELPDRRL